MTRLVMHKKRQAWLCALLLIAAGELSGPAAAEPIVHEYFDPNPAEDVALGTTTRDGTMAAAIKTASGIVKAPDPNSPASSSNETYGEDPSGEGSDKSYHIDRNTTRPDVVSYSDPFTPSIPPFKRLYAYDSVGADFELRVSDGNLAALTIGGDARDTDDQFYADMQVDAAPRVAIRIPSTGPDTRVLVARTEPETRFQLLHDRADNWFIRTDYGSRLRLILQLAIDRRTFGGAFANTSWASLRRFLPTIPDDVSRAAREVASNIGVSPEDSPSQALTTLVAYFRGFTASDQALTEAGRDLYIELCSSKKGVCRHRAYGFVVTALGLGLPARFVHNEAHAWVEVFDGTLFHRIDLGGAAGRVELDADQRPTHVLPPDPRPWPPGGTSAQAMTERARNERAAGALGASGTDPAEAQSSKEPSTNPNPNATETSEQPANDAPAAQVDLEVDETETRRGGRIRVSGDIEADGKGCDQVRVDIAFRRATGSHDDTGERFALGTLVTSSVGAFSGSLVVPFTLPVGDYQVVATTPGRSLVCGRGSSE